MTVVSAPIQAPALVRVRHPNMARLVVYTPLLAILALQAVVSLRLGNSAFMDEALYLNAGQLYFNHIFLGGPPPPGWAAGLSGMPYFYPLLAGALGDIAPNHSWWLESARDLSLCFMLCATIAVYDLTKRIYDRDSALLAAALFASQASVQFLSHFATYDAMSLALIALAAVLAQRASTARRPFLAPVVVVVLLVAVGTKYVGLMFVPSVLALLALQTVHARGWWSAVVRVGLACAALGSSGILALLFLDQNTRNSLYVSSLHRLVKDPSPRLPMAEYALTLGGFLVVLGLIGLCLRGRAPLPLRVVLLGSGFIAPAYHIYTGEPISMHKHIAFGLFFVAPLAGHAVARLSGYGQSAPVGRRWLAGLAICVLAFSLGQNQAWGMYDIGWPNSDAATHILRTQARPGTSHILTDEQEVVRFYLSDLVSPQQYSNFYYFGYTDARGRYLSGVDAYRAAIAEGYFDLVVFSYREDLRDTAHVLDGMLRHSKRYQLIARVRFPNMYHRGSWWVWRKRA